MSPLGSMKEETRRVGVSVRRLRRLIGEGGWKRVDLLDYSESWFGSSRTMSGVISLVTFVRQLPEASMNRWLYVESQAVEELLKLWVNRGPLDRIVERL